MKKGQIIGLAVTGLAVVGGLAIFNWVKKPKATRGAFLSADGVRGGKVSSNCGRINSDGSASFYTDVTGGGCKKGFKAVRYFGDRESLR